MHPITTEVRLQVKKWGRVMVPYWVVPIRSVSNLCNPSVQVRMQH